jgi:pimeloyl-ACP methyl ester carboxylesterase
MASLAYVLLHGAWHGGWCWRFVADGLRELGHRVFTPTQTGLGERKHPLTSDITLETFVQDLLNVLEMEELAEVILVGHSFGGLAISGAADRAPARIRHLVYLDSVILQDSQTVFGVLPADIVAARRKLALEQGRGVAMPIPPVSAFGIPEDHPRADWVRGHLTPHPVSTYETPLRLKHPVGNGRPCTYIACTDPLYEPLAGVREWVKPAPGWAWQEIATGHDAMVTAPEMLTEMLVRIGES